MKVRITARGLTLGLLLLGFSIGFVRSAAADSIIPVDPTATFLLTNSDPGSRAAVPISLSSLGLAPGDEIGLQTVGSFCYYAPDCSKFNVPPPGLTAVFSSSGTLLLSNVSNRVPGAIGGVGAPVVGWMTFYGQLPTDISQDFFIPHTPGITEVTIPTGAQFLFVAAEDTLYGDNLDDGFGLKISRVPEPSVLVMLASGLLLLVFIQVRSSR